MPTGWGEEMADTNTSKEMLGTVQAALKKVLEGGQEIKQGSHRIVRADLAKIAALEKDFNARAAAEESAGVGLFDDCYTALFDGR